MESCTNNFFLKSIGNFMNERVKLHGSGGGGVEGGGDALGTQQYDSLYVVSLKKIKIAVSTFM